MTTVSAIAGVISNMSADILVKFFLKLLIVCVVIFVGSHL